jgi:hypothetical protein
VGGDAFGPFHEHVPRGAGYVPNHKVIEPGAGLQSVGIDVEDLAAALVDVQ